MTNPDVEKKIKSEDFKGCCCQKAPSHLVTYDSGEDNDVWFVCPDHMKSHEWNSFIVKIVEVNM